MLFFSRPLAELYRARYPKTQTRCGATIWRTPDTRGDWRKKAQREAVVEAKERLGGLLKY